MVQVGAAGLGGAGGVGRGCWRSVVPRGAVPAACCLVLVLAAVPRGLPPWLLLRAPVHVPAHLGALTLTGGDKWLFLYCVVVWRAASGEGCVFSVYRWRQRRGVRRTSLFFLFFLLPTLPRQVFYKPDTYTHVCLDMVLIP